MFLCVCYLRGQDGWRHLVTKVGLGGDLGLGAASALCYAAATQHGVYILIGEDTKTHTVVIVKEMQHSTSFVIQCNEKKMIS